MRLVAVAFITLMAIAQPAAAQTLTPPEAQATAEMARADANRASAQATSVSRLATANAPTATPPATPTPVPTSTPTPTATPEPTATATFEPTATATAQPAATPTVAAAPETPAQPPLSSPVMVLVALVGCIAMVATFVLVWRFFLKPRERMEPND